MEVKWKAGSELTQDEKGVWKVRVDKNIDNTNLLVAYNVTTSNTDDKAEYAATDVAAATIEWGKWYDIDVTIGGSAQPVVNVFDTAKKIVHNKNANDENTWEFRVNDGKVQFRITNPDKVLHLATDTLNNSEIKINLVGGYSIYVPLTNTK